jgi:hypothetical protein
MSCTDGVADPYRNQSLIPMDWRLLATVGSEAMRTLGQIDTFGGRRTGVSALRPANAMADSPEDLPRGWHGREFAGRPPLEIRPPAA